MQPAGIGELQQADPEHREHQPLVGQPAAARHGDRQRRAENRRGAGEARGVLVGVGEAPVGAEAAVAVSVGRHDRQPAPGEIAAAPRFEPRGRRPRCDSRGRRGDRRRMSQALGTQGLGQIVDRRQQRRRRQAPGHQRCAGHPPQQRQAAAGEASPHQVCAEAGGKQADIQLGLGMAGEQQRRERQHQQQDVPAPALTRVALRAGSIRARQTRQPRQRVEDARQQGRRAGDGPTHPEQHEAAQAERERADQRGSLAQTLAPQQQVGEHQGQEHPQRRHHRRPPHRRERQRQDGQRGDRLRLGIGKQRHAGAGAGVPQGPAAGLQSSLRGRQRRHHQLDQIALEQIAVRLAGRHQPEGHLAAQVVERQQHPAAAQRAAEQHPERHRERAKHAPGHRVVPAPQDARKEQRQTRHVKSGRQVEQAPLGHRRQSTVSHRPGPTRGVNPPPRPGAKLLAGRAARSRLLASLASGAA